MRNINNNKDSSGNNRDATDDQSRRRPPRLNTASSSAGRSSSQEQQDIDRAIAESLDIHEKARENRQQKEDHDLSHAIAASMAGQAGPSSSTATQQREYDRIRQQRERPDETEGLSYEDQLAIAIAMSEIDTPPKKPICDIDKIDPAYVTIHDTHDLMTQIISNIPEDPEKKHIFFDTLKEPINRFIGEDIGVIDNDLKFVEKIKDKVIHKIDMLETHIDGDNVESVRNRSDQVDLYCLFTNSVEQLNDFYEKNPQIDCDIEVADIHHNKNVTSNDKKQHLAENTRYLQAIRFERLRIQNEQQEADARMAQNMQDGLD